MDKKLKVGVIGTGSISEMHLNAYRNHPDVELRAVCDWNAERAGKAAARYGAAKSFGDAREMLADPELTAVSICTWNSAHAELSIAALNAGKHVLVEKPLCMTVGEALDIQRAVRASGRLLMVGFVRRYDPGAKLLRRFADQGEFGEIYYAKASILRRLGNPGGWFADAGRSGGGPLIDIGVHAIDLCWYLMGKPKVAAVTGNVYRKLGNRANVKGLSFYKASDYDASHNNVEDLANALIRFEGGASLFVDCSYSLHIEQDEASARLFGTKGGCQVIPELSIVTEKHDTILNVTPQLDRRDFDFAGAFQAEIDHFVDCACRGVEPISPVEDGVEVMKMLCGIYESARTGREVRFGDGEGLSR
ncbi:Gfo/Idh/MocA family protein [Cohnella caldifontis]|uniref:Gfo/Idh/MocA family protein n=1 Tax=Cohnella caldifontis TaxID=3027471 RepID=UPI0023EAA173|nr:Gfo/Idh/MocA family oxidoreductase [Cohnella sp. YIM B05605]